MFIFFQVVCFKRFGLFVQQFGSVLIDMFMYQIELVSGVVVIGLSDSSYVYVVFDDFVRIVFVFIYVIYVGFVMSHGQFQSVFVIQIDGGVDFVQFFVVVQSIDSGYIK